MAYAVYTDVTYAIPTSIMSDLETKLSRTAQQLAESAIADADAEIDLWNTSDWTTAQKLGCSKALAIEKVYQLDARAQRVPPDIKAEADKWRNLLQLQEESWDGIIADPVLDEPDLELQRLREGLI